jgi:hypothetical protein
MLVVGGLRAKFRSHACAVTAEAVTAEARYGMYGSLLGTCIHLPAWYMVLRLILLPALLIHT